MNWGDERYVRLYLRPTAEWRALCWQAKALHPLLLKAADRAGIVDVPEGPRRLKLLAALVELPLEVVAVGLPDLLEDGCVQECSMGYVWPNYLEANETPATPKLRSKEYRDRQRAERRLRALQSVTKRDGGVTVRFKTSPRSIPCLTKEDPLSAVPAEPPDLRSSGSGSRGGQGIPDSPATPPEPPGPPLELEPVPAPSLAKKARQKAKERPSDPLHTELKQALMAVFSELRGTGYGFAGGADAKALTTLLAMSRLVEVHVRRWRLALTLPPNRGGCSSLRAFASRWNDYAQAPDYSSRDITRGVAPVSKWDAQTAAEFEATGREFQNVRPFRKDVARG